MTLREIITTLETLSFTLQHTKPKVEAPNLDVGNLVQEVTTLSKTQSQNEDEISDTLLNRLEHKMLSLDRPTLLLYLFYQLGFNLFNDVFVTMAESASRFKTLAPYDLELSTLHNLCMIHKYISINTYYLIIPPFALPWSDVILPKYYHRYNDLTIGFGIPKEFLSLSDPNLVHIVNMLLNGDTQVVTSPKWTTWTRQNFIENTSPLAVGINGTACVGKTTIIDRAIASIQVEIDPNADIIKAGKYGGYRGKDNEQALAMEYQAIVYGLMQEQYTSIADRDMYNNLIWRFILSHQDTKNCTAENIVQHVTSKISTNMIQIMRKQPIIIIVDLDALKNRRRMFRRAMGGDRLRCFIEYYVPAQNALYGLFAYLCGWPIFNRNFDDKLNQQDEIVDLMVSKIKDNVERYDMKLPTENTLTLGKFSYDLEPDQYDYNTAVSLGIFK